MQITLTNLGAVTPDEAEETLQTVTDFLKGLNLEKLITLLLPFWQAALWSCSWFSLPTGLSSAWSWSGACIPSSMRPCGLFCG